MILGVSRRIVALKLLYPLMRQIGRPVPPVTWSFTVCLRALKVTCVPDAALTLRGDRRSISCRSSILSLVSRSQLRKSVPNISAPSPASQSSALTLSARPRMAQRLRSRCSFHLAWRGLEAHRTDQPSPSSGLLAIVFVSYLQTIDAYPHGAAGSCTGFASENLAAQTAGLLAAALPPVIDYILNSRPSESPPVSKAGPGVSGASAPYAGALPGDPAHPHADQRMRREGHRHHLPPSPRTSSSARCCW